MGERVQPLSSGASKAPRARGRILRNLARRLPDHTSSPRAEAAAGATAEEVLRGRRPCSIVIAGDNPTAVGVLSGWQRTSDEATRTILARAAGLLHAAGWRPQWRRIRREDNGAADRAARTAGLGTF